MATRPRVLFLSQCLPYPPHSGVASRTFNILKQLHIAYDVDLVAFSRASHQPDRAARDAARAALQAVGAVVAEPTPIPHQHSALPLLWVHLRRLRSLRSCAYYDCVTAGF